MKLIKKAASVLTALAMTASVSAASLPLSGVSGIPSVSAEEIKGYSLSLSEELYNIDSLKTLGELKEANGIASSLQVDSVTDGTLDNRKVAEVKFSIDENYGIFSSQFVFTYDEELVFAGCSRYTEKAEAGKTAPASNFVTLPDKYIVINSVKNKVVIFFKDAQNFYEEGEFMKLLFVLPEKPELDHKYKVDFDPYTESQILPWEDGVKPVYSAKGGYISLTDKEVAVTTPVPPLITAAPVTTAEETTVTTLTSAVETTAALTTAGTTAASTAPVTTAATTAEITEPVTSAPETTVTTTAAATTVTTTAATTTVTSTVTTPAATAPVTTSAAVTTVVTTPAVTEAAPATEPLVDIILDAADSGLLKPEMLSPEKTELEKGASIDLKVDEEMIFRGTKEVAYKLYLSDFDAEKEYFDYAGIGLELPEGFSLRTVKTDARAIVKKIAPDSFESMMIESETDYAANGGYVMFRGIDTSKFGKDDLLCTIILNVPEDADKFVYDVAFSSVFGRITDKTVVNDDGTVSPYVSLINNGAGDKLYKLNSTKLYTGLRGDVNLDGKVSQADATLLLKDVLSVSVSHKSILKDNINKDAAGDKSEALAVFLGDVDSSDGGKEYKQVDATYMLKAILAADVAGSKVITPEIWSRFIEV